jgi:hypothetical protein
LALFIGYGLTAQVYYTQRSLGGVGGGFVEVPRASDSRLISQLIEISHRERSRAIVSDTYNVVLAKFQANYTMSVPLFFTSQDFIGHFLEKGLRPGLWQAVLNGIIPNLNATLRAIYEERSKRYREVQFDTHGALTSANHFTTATGADDSELLHATLLLTPGQSVLNRRHTPEAERSVFRTLDWAEARDQLFYVASDFGRNYYTDSGTRSSGRIAMFQLERDYFYKHATMVSMGRDTLLRVINPSPEFRLALEYTASLNADHENRIPPVSVVGAQRQFLAVAGRGSARLFSPVVQTQDIGGGRYLMLDMGTAGFRFPNRRKGLMTLWGRDIPLDARVIAGFGRDVSALSEREYEALAAPGQVQKFPADLANKSLEYSGVYEDGWVAESSYFTLGQSTAGLPLVVRVLVPLIGSQAAASRIIVLVDGAEVARRNLGPGDADLKIPGPGIGKHRIDLTFDRATRLPGIDGRPVSALIRFVGFRGD